MGRSYGTSCCLPDILDAHQDDIVDLNDPDSARPNLSARFETIGRRADGSTFPAEAALSCSVQDNLTHYTLIVRDITVFRELEWQEAQHSIEAGARDRDARIPGGNLHDLRTPLTVMATNLYLLERVKDEQKRRHRVMSMRTQSITSMGWSLT